MGSTGSPSSQASACSTGAAGVSRSRIPSSRPLSDSPWKAQPADGVALALASDAGADGRAMRLDVHFHGGGGYAAAHPAEEAVVATGVAGDAGLLDERQRRIAVAVYAQLHQGLDVP